MPLKSVTPNNSSIRSSDNPFVSRPNDDPFNPSTRQRGDVGLSMGGTNLLSKLNGRNPALNGRHHNVETPVANSQEPGDEDLMMGEDEDFGGRDGVEPALDPTPDCWEEGGCAEDL